MNRFVDRLIDKIECSDQIKRTCPVLTPEHVLYFLGGFGIYDLADLICIFKHDECTILFVYNYNVSRL